MGFQKTTPAAAVAGIVAMMLSSPSLAQTDVQPEVAAPDYSSVSSSSLPNRSFNTPESDGRPGAKFFAYGVQAFRKGDYRHAIDMYKVAASWAYKPAEYNLGVMYFKGQGVPADRARGAAWMILAAERGDSLYVKARDLMVTTLTKAEFQRTDDIWSQLKPTYGDAVALRRAKARWAQVKADTTGSRVGAAASEYLMVGGSVAEAPPHTHGSKTSIGAVGAPPAVTGWDVFGGRPLTDGSVAYQQFQQSSNPYDPVFLQHHAGSVTIEPLQPVKPVKKNGKDTSGSAQPEQPVRNA